MLSQGQAVWGFLQPTTITFEKLNTIGLRALILGRYQDKISGGIMSSGTAEVLVPNGDGDDYTARGLVDAEAEANRDYVVSGIDRLIAFVHRTNVLDVGGRPSLQAFHDKLYNHVNWQEARRQIGASTGRIIVRREVPPMIEDFPN